MYTNLAIVPELKDTNCSFRRVHKRGSLLDKTRAGVVTI